MSARYYIALDADAVMCLWYGDPEMVADDPLVVAQSDIPPELWTAALLLAGEYERVAERDIERCREVMGRCPAPTSHARYAERAGVTLESLARATPGTHAGRSPVTRQSAGAAAIVAAIAAGVILAGSMLAQLPAIVAGP